MHNYYYILEGKKVKPVDEMTEWARWYETADRTVKKTELTDCKVSTVFLAMNHAFGHGDPILFETMIFGGEHDGYCERCSTWEQAEAQHQKAINTVLEIKQ
jgi:hypothetical protein